VALKHEGLPVPQFLLNDPVPSFVVIVLVPHVYEFPFQDQPGSGNTFTVSDAAQIFKTIFPPVGNIRFGAQNTQFWTVDGYDLLLQRSRHVD